MKRILCTIFALFMLCSVLILTACGNADQKEENTTEATTTEATTTAETTTGEEKTTSFYTEWATYDDGTFSFSYPKTWGLMEGMVGDSELSNSIVVMTEPKNDSYAQMDTATYKNEMEALFAAMGLSVVEASVEQTKLENGLDATVMFYALEMEDVWMGETTVAITIGETTYSVVISEVVKDTGLLETVLASLAITPAA